MSTRSLLAISILTLAACSDDSGGGTPDAPRADAQTSRVMEVTCPATTPVTFTTLESRFDPPTAAITMGQIVKLVSDRSDHPIGPIPLDSMSDPGLVVPGGQTKCFSFLATGTFRFRCTQHGYAGTITVN